MPPEIPCCPECGKPLIEGTDGRMYHAPDVAERQFSDFPETGTCSVCEIADAIEALGACAACGAFGHRGDCLQECPGCEEEQCPKEFEAGQSVCAGCRYSESWERQGPLVEV